MTWQALTEALEKATEGVEVPGFSKPEIMSCLTIGVSELGTFLRPDDKELVDVLVAMWDGQKEVWRRTTRTQGETSIQNPWLNVIGCTTPAWLRNNFPDVLIGGGLTSRMVFVFADKKRQLVAYPADMITSSEYETEEEYLLHDLAQIAQLCGEYRLTPDAKRWGEEWYELHWTSARPLHLASDRFSGYIARKQTHIHKLAMVLAAAKRNTLQIEEEDLIEASTAIVEIERDMEHVFSSIGVMQGAKTSTEILALVRNHGTIEYQRLWQLCFNTMASKDFIESLKAAIEAGFLKLEQREFRGKPTKFVSYTGPNPQKPTSPSGNQPGGRGRKPSPEPGSESS